MDGDLHLTNVDNQKLGLANIITNYYYHYILFLSNKSYGYLLNVKLSNLVFFKTGNAEFDNTTVTFMDQNGRLLEIEDRVNLIWLINK